MKYSKEELEILRTQGKKALIEYRRKKRIPLGKLANRVIETRKNKNRYPHKIEDED